MIKASVERRHRTAATTFHPSGAASPEAMISYGGYPQVDLGGRRVYPPDAPTMYARRDLHDHSDTFTAFEI